LTGPAILRIGLPTVVVLFSLFLPCARDRRTDAAVRLSLERLDGARGSGAARRQVKITSREKKQNREVWTVEGLIHPGLKRTVFTFKQRSLVAVELQYEYPDWSIEKYNQRMGEIRKYFDEKYGTGKLVSRARDNDTEVIQTLVGYQWLVGGTMLELFYFSAQHERLVYRTITVDYKAL
jgi:hypothetical protein